MRSLWETAVLFSPPMTLPDFRVGNAASICARSAALEVEIAERGLAPATGAPFTRIGVEAGDKECITAQTDTRFRSPESDRAIGKVIGLSDLRFDCLRRNTGCSSRPNDDLGCQWRDRRRRKIHNGECSGRETLHAICGSGRMNSCLANLLFGPFNSRFGEIESRGSLSQVGRNFVIILYRDPRPHTCSHQSGYDEKRGKQNHSRFVTDEFSLGGHELVSFVAQCWSRVWMSYSHPREDPGSLLAPQTRS